MTNGNTPCISGGYTNMMTEEDSDLIRRSDALECFHDWVDRYGDVHTPDEMAEYRAIEELPSVEPKHTEKRTETRACDLISRQAAIDFVDDVPYIKDHPNIGLLWKAWVEQLPSAQPETHDKRTKTHACDCINCSEIPNNSDAISRQAAIDAIGGNKAVGDPSQMDEDEVIKMWERIRIINVLNHLPSAEPETHEERTETHSCDLISRQAVTDTVRKIILGFFSDEDGVMTDTEKTLLSVNKAICNGVRELPSAQPEVKPIGYQDCANAMLKMWMDNVLTDGEYYRIMDKLNAHWGMENE